MGVIIAIYYINKFDNGRIMCYHKHREAFCGKVHFLAKCFFVFIECFRIVLRDSEKRKSAFHRLWLHRCRLVPPASSGDKLR